MTISKQEMIAFFDECMAVLNIPTDIGKAAVIRARLQSAVVVREDHVTLPKKVTIAMRRAAWDWENGYGKDRISPDRCEEHYNAMLSAAPDYVEE